MRRLLLVAVLVGAHASSAFACDCMAAPADNVAGTYRAITGLLCLLPLAFGFGLARWLGRRIAEAEAAETRHTPTAKPNGLVVLKNGSRAQQPIA